MLKKFKVVTYVYAGSKIIVKSSHQVVGYKADAEKAAEEIYNARGLYQGGEEKIAALEVGSDAEANFNKKLANV